jgi:hypothetical protein
VYVVAAPYLTVFAGTPDGPRVTSLFAGQPVPDDAPVAWITRQLAAGRIVVKETQAERDQASGRVTVRGAG